MALRLGLGLERARAVGPVASVEEVIEAQAAAGGLGEGVRD